MASDFPLPIQAWSALLHALGRSETEASRVAREAEFYPVSGGCINRCYRVRWAGEQVFLKLNSASRFPGMFRAEAGGLGLLRRPGAPRVPQVLGWGEGAGANIQNSPADSREGSTAVPGGGSLLTGPPAADTAWLWLEWLERATPRPDYSEHLGRELAVLHRCSAAQFGGLPDNYIGSLPQRNAAASDWAEFYRENRLEPARALARKRLAGRMPKALEAALDRFSGALEAVFPPEAPTLQHGDLWSGNVLCGPDGSAALVDPAASYGHREADLAMSLLFGGFEPGFYRAYDETFPLQPGWEQRMPAHQVYPLLVHVALFGASYLPELSRAVPAC